MNNLNLKTLLGTATATAFLICATGEAARAGSLYGGWNYAIDSFQDGVNGSIIGSNSKYEFYGMAIKEDVNSISVAINANLGLGGEKTSGARNGSIAWGDLFFNFTGSNLNKANRNSSLFAIHFDAENDATGTSGLGVYSNVKAMSVTRANRGFGNLNSHYNYVTNKGGTASMADLAEKDTYFKNKTYNVIKKGTKIGDIDLLDEGELSQEGLDFGNFGAIGTNTFGFSFDKSLLPADNYIAHIFAECANDGMAIKGEIKGVPEPSSMAGLAMLGATVAGSQLRKRRRIRV